MLDYSIPQFSFVIGGWDATEYLDSLSISLPMAEMGAPLIWTGDFTLSYNLAAKVNGVAEVEFDEWSNPDRWRQAKAQVVLTINGHTLPVLRIDRYSYDPVAFQGRGTLTQILGLPVGDRPSSDPELEVLTQGGITQGLAAVAHRMLVAALSPPYCSLSVGVLGTGVPGSITGKITTRNPLADANRIAGNAWRWLWVDNLERVTSTTGDPGGNPMVFSRTEGTFEWLRDLDGIEMPSDRVIVSGQYNRIKPPPPDEPPPPNADGKARPRFQKTEESQPIGKYSTPPTSDETPIISERKWIFYWYPDTKAWPPEAAPFLPSSLISLAQADPIMPDADPDAPAKTATVTQWPRARIFPDLENDFSLSIDSIQYQSEYQRAEWQAAGKVFPDTRPNDLSTVLAKREVLQTPPVNKYAQVAYTGEIDPVTGLAKRMEPIARPEARQPAPDYDIEPVPVRGVALTQPVGWVPAINRTSVVDVGFLPDEGAAIYLARQIANREARRRNQLEITMPLPIEWLAAGCPPLARCTLGIRGADNVIRSDQHQIDGPIIRIGDGRAELAFSAARITYDDAPVAIQRVDYDARVELLAVASYADPAFPPPPPLELDARIEWKLGSAFAAPLDVYGLSTATLVIGIYSVEATTASGSPPAVTPVALLLAAKNTLYYPVIAQTAQIVNVIYP